MLTLTVDRGRSLRYCIHIMILTALYIIICLYLSTMHNQNPMLSNKDIQKNRKTFRENDRSLAATFKSLGEINRFRIFKILVSSPMISVSTVAEILELSVPLTSQHVKSLVAVQLLTKIRSGKIVYLQLNLKNPVVEEVLRSIRRGQMPKVVGKVGS